MTTVAMPDAAKWRPHRSWRLLRLAALNERAFRVRLVIAPMMMPNPISSRER